MSQTRGRLMFHNKSQSREHIRCERNICSYTRQRESPFHTLWGGRGKPRQITEKIVQIVQRLPTMLIHHRWTLNDRRRGEWKPELSKQISRSAGRVYFWEANVWSVSNVHAVQKCTHINCCKLGLHKALLPDSVTEPSLSCLGFLNMSPGGISELTTAESCHTGKWKPAYLCDGSCFH